MERKFLGKITSAEFGSHRDYPFMFGILLTFAFEGSVCDCGAKYAVNIHKDCKWTVEQRAEACMESIDKIHEILEAANCLYLSELVNKPVEITLDGDLFKDFRILTEVI